jgi:hypothetical protein
MIGAGTIISPIIRIVTTVAILAAVYFFIVKPTLDTTNTAFESIGNLEVPEAVSPQIEDTIREAQQLQRKANKASAAQIDQASKLLDCINDAGGDVDKISNCNQKFSP